MITALGCKIDRIDAKKFDKFAVMQQDSETLIYDLKCQFDENRHQFFPHFFAQNSQFNRKTFFDANKIEYNHSLGRKKLL